MRHARYYHGFFFLFVFYNLYDTGGKLREINASLSSRDHERVLPGGVFTGKAWGGVQGYCRAPPGSYYVNMFLQHRQSLDNQINTMIFYPINYYCG